MIIKKIKEFPYLKKSCQKINKIIDRSSWNPYRSNDTLKLGLKVLSPVKIKISKEYSLINAKTAHEDLEARKLTVPAILIP